MVVLVTKELQVPVMFSVWSSLSLQPHSSQKTNFGPWQTMGVLVETAGVGMFLFLSRKLVFKCFELFGDVLATYCVRRPCSFRGGLRSRNCKRPLIMPVAIDTEDTCKDFRSDHL